MTLRARIFILISLAALLVLGVSVFLLLRNRNKQAAGQPNQTTANTTEDGKAIIDSSNFSPDKITAPLATDALPSGMTVKPATPEEVQKNAVKQLAKIFVERYGTYSTDSDYENIKEVQSLVTAQLWGRISGRLSTPQTGPFVGVTTKAISTSVVTWSNTSAGVDVQITKATEQNGQTTNAQQATRVNLVKQGDAWLVDSFSTQN